MQQKLNIVWMSWKDLRNPRSGGAEVVAHELCKRLALDGHIVTLATSKVQGLPHIEQYEGYTIVRHGGRLSVYLKTWLWYRNLEPKPDVVIDEMNTLPFFSIFYSQRPVILFVHQLARKVWFYEMAFPVSLLGYLLEPLYLRFLSSLPVVTVSESTRNDLLRFGFKGTQTRIIREGTTIPRLETLPPMHEQKQEIPTILSLGAMRPMKRTHDIVRAFEIARKVLASLRLAIAGDAGTAYGRSVLAMIDRSPYQEDITYHGRISTEEKTALMQKAHIILVTSVKEGWGLIVTEAASQGTPAVVYDVDGLRDSVLHSLTGLCVEETPEALAAAVLELLNDPKRLSEMRRNAWEASKTCTFDQAYTDFASALAEFLDAASTKGRNTRNISHAFTRTSESRKL